MRLRTLKQPRWMLIGANRQNATELRAPQLLTEPGNKAPEPEPRQPPPKLVLVK